MLIVIPQLKYVAIHGQMLIFGFAEAATVPSKPPYSEVQQLGNQDLALT